MRNVTFLAESFPETDLVGDCNSNGFMMGTFEKSPLINSKETVISLDYVRILSKVKEMLKNYFAGDLQHCFTS